MHFIIPLINFIGLELVLRSPRLIYGVGGIVIFLTLVFIYRQRKNALQHTFAIVLSAMSFLGAHYLLLVFLEGRFLTHMFIILTSFALFVFLYSLHDKYNQNQLRLPYAMPNIIGYFNLAVFFFLSVGLFYLDLQSNQKFMWYVGVFTVVTVALTYSSFDIFKLIGRKSVIYLGVIVFIMVEVFWMVKLLPFSVYSQGALVALVYYVALGLSRHYLIFGDKELTRRVVGRYLTISMLGTILILASARWG